MKISIHVNFAHDNCIVCKKNVKGQKDARSDNLYRDDFAACFGISDSPVGKVWERCRKAVTDFRETRKTFFNVSTIE